MKNDLLKILVTDPDLALSHESIAVGWLPTATTELLLRKLREWERLAKYQLGTESAS